LGIFCANIILKGPESDEIARYLSQRGRAAWVSDTADHVTAGYDQVFQRGHAVITRRFEASHLPHLYRRGETEWEPLARDLSAAFHCPVLATEIHDSDFVFYELFESGRLMDEYLSALYRFDPVADMEFLARPIADHAAMLCRAFGTERAMATVAGILADAGEPSNTYFANAHGQLWEVLQAMGLPEGCGCGTVLPTYGVEGIPGFTATKPEIGK
jgi:hypothetical protein